MKMFADGISCVAVTEEFDCVSASVVYRITLSLLIFSALMAGIIMIASDRVAKIVN